jgi:UbiD family decarboxylase
MAAAPTDLRRFLAILEREGDLVRVRAEVDAELELAEVHRRVIAANGPAILFERVRDRDMPVVTNLFGTARRIELAFGAEPRRLVEQAAALPDELMPPSFGRLWGQRRLLAALARVGVKRLRSGPVVATRTSPPRLTRLPALKTWPRDGGGFVTLPLVYTERPGGDGHHASNLGMYRIQVHDETHTGLHVQIGKGGGFHLAEAERLGRPLPVNVHVGGPPAAILAAIAPLPENVPEVLLASLVVGGRLRMCDNPAGPLPLLADAELALVGEVEPGARHPEGPFGDHYGYYSETHDYPLFTCRTLLARRDAIFPATVVGKPRQEDFYLGDHLQELLGPILPRVMPAVRDLWSYGETGFHALAAAVVRERYPREAMASAFRILGEGQLSLTKFLLVTDTPLDLRDFPAVLEHILARFNPATDLYVFANLSMDTLDYTGPEVNKGSKGILLGLGDPIRDLPRQWTGQPPARAFDPLVFCGGCLVLGGPAYAEAPGFAAELAKAPELAQWPLVVLTDQPRRAVASPVNFLWTTFMRFEPAGDIYASQQTIQRHHIAYSTPIVIDARVKPWYPGELFADPAIARKVGERWKEYFPAGNVEMGSSDLAHLTPE